MVRCPTSSMRARARATESALLTASPTACRCPSQPCKGDIRTTCGGSGFMSLFTNATTATTASFTIVDGQVQLV